MTNAMAEQRPESSPPTMSRDEWRLTQIEAGLGRVAQKVDALTASVTTASMRIEALYGAHYPASDGKVMAEKVDTLRRDVDTLNSRAWMIWVAVIQGGAGMIIALILAALRWQSHGA